MAEFVSGKTKGVAKALRRIYEGSETIEEDGEELVETVERVIQETDTMREEARRLLLSRPAEKDDMTEDKWMAQVRDAASDEFEPVVSDDKTLLGDTKKETEGALGAFQDVRKAVMQLERTP
jgi:pyridoxal biosynthesis lyase PdxS